MPSVTHPIERAPAHTVPLPATSLPAIKLGPGGGNIDLPKATVEWVALDKIHTSPFNPRQEFDAAGIAELAESIKARGLQQNINVRPHPKKPGEYELTGGERRLRALRLIKAEGAMCKIMAASDAESIAVQMVENLQRQDLGALEEAEGFKRLQDQDPKVWTVQKIAAAVGKTDRFVQQRLAIATNLSAPLKKKFADGDISIEAARTLAPLPVSVQNSIPSWAIENGDADDIRQQAFHLCIPESAAKFPIASYTGAWIEGDKGRRYFADAVLFRKLQTGAAEKKLVEVQKDWPGAKLIDADKAKELRWADDTYGWNGLDREHRDGDVPKKWNVAKDKCQAVVWIAPNGEIRKALGVCSKAAIEAATKKRQTSSSPRFKSPEGEKKDHKVAREAFNAAIAKAAAKDPVFADRLFIFRVLNDDFDFTYTGINKAVPKDIAKLQGRGDARGMAELWRAIGKMTPAQCRTVGRDLLLGDIPTWEDFEWKEKPLLPVAIAESLGVTPPAIALPEPQKKVEAKPAPKTAPKVKPTAKAKAVKKKKGAR